MPKCGINVAKIGVKKHQNGILNAKYIHAKTGILNVALKMPIIVLKFYEKDTRLGDCFTNGATFKTLATFFQGQLAILGLFYKLLQKYRSRQMTIKTNKHKFNKNS